MRISGTVDGVAIDIVEESYGSGGSFGGPWFFGEDFGVGGTISIASTPAGGSVDPTKQLLLIPEGTFHAVYCIFSAAPNDINTAEDIRLVQLSVSKLGTGPGVFP